MDDVGVLDSIARMGTLVFVGACDSWRLGLVYSRDGIANHLLYKIRSDGISSKPT